MINLLARVFCLFVVVTLILSPNDFSEQLKIWKCGKNKIFVLMWRKKIIVRPVGRFSYHIVCVLCCACAGLYYRTSCDCMLFLPKSCTFFLMNGLTPFVQPASKFFCSFSFWISRRPIVWVAHILHYAIRHALFQFQ